MGSSARPRAKANLGRQVGALRSKYPNGRTNFARGVVTWVGPLQPTRISRVYTVKVEFQNGWNRPKITVLRPILKEPDDGPLPHVFPGDRLCLHFPREWHADQMIAATIMPWISEWLVHYEIWKATGGEWHGGGHEPMRKPEE